MGLGTRLRLGHNDVAFLHRGIAITYDRTTHASLPPPSPYLLPLHRGIAITYDRTTHAGLLKYFKMTYQQFLFFFFVESDNKQQKKTAQDFIHFELTVARAFNGIVPAEQG